MKGGGKSQSSEDPDGGNLTPKWQGRLREEERLVEA